MRSNKLKKAGINLFYIPALCLFAVFVIYPLFKGLRISFYRWNGFSQNMRFVGFSNYERMFKDSKVIGAFVNTLIYGCGSTFLQNVIGLGYAVLLNARFVGKSAARAIIYLPSMIASLIMGYIMYFFVQYDNGALNDIRALFGMGPLDWMADGTRAVWIMTIINSLQYVGGCMIIYLAGLQNVPQMYLEAAMIDGANPWQKFWRVTFPLLMPAISSAVVINLIGGLKLFDIIMAMTKGGPGFKTHSMSTMVSYQYLNAESAGYSAVIGLASFFMIVILGNLMMTFFNKKEL